MACQPVLVQASMALTLYRRHRLECEAGRPEDAKSGEWEERRRGWKRCDCVIHLSGTLDGKFSRRATTCTPQKLCPAKSRPEFPPPDNYRLGCRLRAAKLSNRSTPRFTVQLVPRRLTQPHDESVTLRTTIRRSSRTQPFWNSRTFCADNCPHVALISAGSNFCGPQACSVVRRPRRSASVS